MKIADKGEETINKANGIQLHESQRVNICLAVEHKGNHLVNDQ
jgi:hypothetical protein